VVSEIVGEGVGQQFAFGVIGDEEGVNSGIYLHVIGIYGVEILVESGRGGRASFVEKGAFGESWDEG